MQNILNIGHRRNRNRILNRELCAAEIKGKKRGSRVLILTFSNGKQKTVREKDWYRYMLIEVFQKMGRQDLGQFLE